MTDEDRAYEAMSDDERADYDDLLSVAIATVGHYGRTAYRPGVPLDMLLVDDFTPAQIDRFRRFGDADFLMDIYYDEASITARELQG